MCKIFPANTYGMALISYIAIRGLFELADDVRQEF